MQPSLNSGNPFYNKLSYSPTHWRLEAAADRSPNNQTLQKISGFLTGRHLILRSEFKRIQLLNLTRSLPSLSTKYLQHLPRTRPSNT